MMLEKIQTLIAEQTGVEAEKIVPGASFKEDLHIDSLDLFEMVMTFEEEFGIEIPNEELENITTVQALLNYMEANV